VNPIVFLEKLGDNSESLRNQLSRSFSWISLAEDFEKAKAIFIKPNLTYPIYKKA